MVADKYFESKNISNSSLSAINPAQNGSPRKFVDFFNGDKEKKYSLSLERGDLVHLYCENKDAFLVSEVEKPSDMMCQWVESVYNYDPTIKQPDENVIESLRQELGLYKNIKDKDKAVKKFSDEGGAYLEFLKESSGKIIMSKDTNRIVTNCISAIENNPKASELIFPSSREGVIVLKEHPVFFQTAVKVPGTDLTTMLDCKAKIDVCTIDFEKKTIELPDIKTTSKGAYNFKDSCEYWRYHRQHAFYRFAILKWLYDTYPYEFKHTDFTIHSYNVVVETDSMHHCVVFGLSTHTLIQGNYEMDSLLERVAWHIYNDVWTMSKEEYENDGVLLLDI